MLADARFEKRENYEEYYIIFKDEHARLTSLDGQQSDDQEQAKLNESNQYKSEKTIDTSGTLLRSHNIEDVLFKDCFA